MVIEMKEENMMAGIFARASEPRKASSMLDALREMQLQLLPELLCETRRAAIVDGVVGGKVMTHFELRTLVEKQRWKIGGGRIGLAVGAGPTAATCLLTTIGGGCAIPINTQHTQSEIETELMETRANGVLVDDPESSAARAARKLGIAVAVVDAKGSNGAFDITAPFDKLITTTNSLEHVALLLHTSGTSGKKKVVPHTLEGLVVGAACVAASWNLSPNDLCLNMMPLNHVGGIVRNLLASVLSGGAVATCPRFDPTLFVDLVRDLGVTWYYSSPTMHELFVAETLKSDKKVKLRLVANAAAALPHSLALKLRETFDAVVLPSYGMTECMPIATPPLEYKLDRPGTSGTSCGPELAILNDDDQPVEIGQVGRICVRGPPLFQGYEIDTSSEENRNHLTPNNYFDTGDLGSLDADGYLYITGRSKEVVNRGGEIISPFEIEEVIMHHSMVRKAMVFAQPHILLDEVVGLVVVVGDDVDSTLIDLADIRRFCQGKLHSSKWPEILVFMDAIPTNEVGKPQRVRFAERVGLTSDDVSQAVAQRHFRAICPPPGPLTVPIALERMRHLPIVDDIAYGGGSEERNMQALINLVEDITGARARPDDHLSSLGFDSLSILQLKNRLREVLGAESDAVSNLMLVSNPTLEEICVAAASKHDDTNDTKKTLSLLALNGLRTLACLEIIRTHGGRHFNTVNNTGIICDANANDTLTVWHTTIFVYLSAMNLAMQYDRKSVSATQLLSNFLTAIIPLYYFAIALVLPIVKDINVVSVVLVLLVQYPAMHGLGPAWYLFNLFWFNVWFNTVRHVIKYSWSCEGSRPYALCCCSSANSPPAAEDLEDPHQCCGCGCLVCGQPVCCNTDAPRRPPKTLGEFTCHFLKWGLIASIMNPTWNPFPPMRVGQFALGVVVGQGVLHVDMNKKECKVVAAVTDILCILLLASKFLNQETQDGLYVLSNIPIAFCCFGLARSFEYSLAAKLLSHEIFTSFVPFTYGAYILHFPLYYWMNFIRRNQIQGYGELVTTTFSESEKRRVGYSVDKYLNFHGSKCGMPWGAHVLVFCASLLGSQIATILIHKPMTKFFARTRFFHRVVGGFIDFVWKYLCCSCRGCMPCIKILFCSRGCTEDNEEQRSEQRNASGVREVEEPPISSPAIHY